MNFASVEQIADAVLYEGYMLYPYRPSAVKNQQRWNFGVVYPESYCQSQPGSGSSCMQTECLLRATPCSRIAVKVRFLQIVERLVGRYRDPDPHLPPGSTDGLEFLDQIEVEGEFHRPLQEAVERAVTCESFDPALGNAQMIEFSFSPGGAVDELRDSRGNRVGAVVRRRKTLNGTLRIEAEPCCDEVVKLTVRIENLSNFDATAARPSHGRDAALLYSLVSAHMILGVDDGEFLSSLDPPIGCENAASACENIGVWPVLAGGNAATMLASPIILYDDPQIAPESTGNLFDGTEIDEILSLRILTLTDEEKKEIRQSDERAKELLERTESIPHEQFLKLHGVLRGLNRLPEASE